MTRGVGIASSLLLGSVLAAGAGLAIWKMAAIRDAAAASANQPEPVESIVATIAKPHDYQPVSTAIGTIVALRSITLSNELPGTVKTVNLDPGQVVESGTVLVALDVSVEQAELTALQAEASLAESLLKRVQSLRQNNAVSEEELDRARAERDVALAQIARTRAIIERKTIRAPFRARIGLSNVHPGQFLNEGTEMTTLQGVDDAVHVDFAIEQQVAAHLGEGDIVEIIDSDRDDATLLASIVAVDARVDATTRNATVRARIDDATRAPAPGASVRVRVPTGITQHTVAVPASALRKGPSGDHVFVLATETDGSMRAHLRPVAVVASLGDEVIIARGLDAGEAVAAAGSFKLRESVLVALADSPLHGDSGSH